MAKRKYYLQKSTFTNHNYVYEYRKIYNFCHTQLCEVSNDEWLTIKIVKSIIRLIFIFSKLQLFLFLTNQHMTFHMVVTFNFFGLIIVHFQISDT